MRIAYIVTAYKNPDQAVRMVRRLDADDVTFSSTSIYLANGSWVRPI